MRSKRIAAVAAAAFMAATFAGCSAAGGAGGADAGQWQTADGESGEEQTPEENETFSVEEEETQEPQEPQTATAQYIRVTGDGVNIRTGAGTSYASLGAAEKATLYACLGEENGWYKTYYKNTAAYISSKYCELEELEVSQNALIESVVREGAKLLGTPYVYGAVRLHDGKGSFYRGFTVTAFDCSSLMQYIFYYGADYLLDVNTRTQIYQGVTVDKSELARGDLLFFTNESRKNNTGIERVGHVALYLGGNYILHTASDYAKIEQITSARWSFFIQAQRIL